MFVMQVYSEFGILSILQPRPRNVQNPGTKKGRDLRFCKSRPKWIIKSSFFGLFFALHQTVFPHFPSHLLVKLCSSRNPVIYEQEVKHFLSVILVDCADQHAV